MATIKEMVNEYNALCEVIGEKPVKSFRTKEVAIARLMAAKEMFDVINVPVVEEPHTAKRVGLVFNIDGRLVKWADSKTSELKNAAVVMIASGEPTLKQQNWLAANGVIIASTL